MSDPRLPDPVARAALDAVVAAILRNVAAIGANRFGSCRHRVPDTAIYAAAPRTSTWQTGPTRMTQTTTPTDDRGSRSRVRVAAAVGAVVLVAAAALVWYFFIRGDAPPAFDIDDAAGALDDEPDPGTTDDTVADPDDSTANDLDGTWVVAAGSGSEAGFRVDEELASIGATTAVGRTQNVDGTLSIDGTAVSDVEVAVDLASLQTDDSRRDNRMRDALAVEEFPTATFVLTEPIVLDDIPAEGDTISVPASGEMTIKGVTNPVEVTLDARLVDDTLVVVGSVPVVFADYGVEAPTSPIAVSVEDNGIVEFQVFFQRG